MSWWFTESIAKTPDGKTLLASFESDDTSIFPNVTQYKVDPTTHLPTGEIDYTIARGSILYCLSNSKTYKLNSQGQWVEQKSGQEIEISADDIVYDNTSSGMTATNVQDAIDEIKDLDDTQDRALAELYGEDANQQLEINYAINTGSKNKLGNKYAVGTVTETNGFRFTAMEDGGIKIESIGTHNANGDYYILGNWGNTQTLLDLSGDTYTATFSSSTTMSGVSLRIFGASNTAIINNLYLNNSRDVTDVEVKFAFITVTSTTTLPENGITVYPMIRNSVIRNATFEPYAPTNRELYETCETKVTMQQAYGDAVAIPANSNLNDYTTPGIYYAIIANVPTITNTPYTATGLRLVVEKNTPSGAAVFQTLYPTSRSHLEFYRRIYEGGSWSSWYKFEGTQVASVQSVSPTLMLNLDRNDLNESLDTNFDLIDSIPEEEEGELE